MNIINQWQIVVLAVIFGGKEYTNNVKINKNLWRMIR